MFDKNFKTPALCQDCRYVKNVRRGLLRRQATLCCHPLVLDSSGRANTSAMVCRFGRDGFLCGPEREWFAPLFVTLKDLKERDGKKASIKVAVDTAEALEKVAQLSSALDAFATQLAQCEADLDERIDRMKARLAALKENNNVQ